MMSQTRSFIPLDRAQSPFYVGIDLGGTNVKVGVVDDLGRPLSWLSIPTEVEKGPEDGARRMGAAVCDAIEQARLTHEAIARVGLGSPGTMDIPAGMLDRPVNMPGWDHFPIRDRVSHHCGLPVSFINDGAAAAYGEFWVGSGRDFHSLVFFTLGTGIGCGIIIGELSIDGQHSHGAECGHIVIDYSDDARICGCGKPGHLEAYASATAVIKRTRQLLDDGAKSSLADRLAAGAELSPKLLAEEAAAGDELSLNLIHEVARAMGVGVANLIHTIDPDGVLLGGAMTFGGNQTELGRQFLAWIKEEVAKRVFDLLLERVVIDFATLGGDAGYIGAAGIARVEYRKGEGVGGRW